MGNNVPFSDYGNYAARTIGCKVHKLIGTYGFIESDREDLEQDLMLFLLEHMHEFDPEKGALKTFICTVVENRIRTVVRLQKVLRKGYGQTLCSLDERLDNGNEGDRLTRLDYIDGDERLIAEGILSRPVFEMVELKTDIQRMISSLPSESQDLCMRLQYQSVREIALERGISRRRISTEIKHLRKLFNRAGLQDYL